MTGFIIFCVCSAIALGVVAYYSYRSFFMGEKATTEIEHRFLVTGESLPYLSKLIQRNRCKAQNITQGYLSSSSGAVIRVRINNTGSSVSCYLTIKGPRVNGICREYEYSIPYNHAVELMEMCQKRVEKTRYKLGRWEIDFFAGANKGLVIAEIELKVENEEYKKPSWLGTDITLDNTYSNNNLAK